MTKFIKYILFGFLLSLAPLPRASASGWPTLFGGKATLQQGSTTFYSTEGFDTDNLHTSRTKVLVAADNSSFAGDCLLLSPTHPVDCLEDGVFGSDNYYKISANAHPNTQVYSGKLSVNGQSVDQESVLVYAGKQVVGDIYSKSQNAFNGFTSYGDYLGLNNPSVNSTWKLSGYNIDPNSLLYWDNSNFLHNSNMKKNVSRLESFATKTGTSSLNVSSFSLYGTGPLSSSTMNPEGRVWSVDGPLALSGTTNFTGKGTIIVNGDLNITGNVTADASSSLGLIVLGNINMTGSSMLNLKAVMFSPNTVVISRPISFTGAIVANKFNITAHTAMIRYDKDLVGNPPPGINYFMTPAVNESF
jgi:hypothetical protein